MTRPRTLLLSALAICLAACGAAGTAINTAPTVPGVVTAQPATSTPTAPAATTAPTPIAASTTAPTSAPTTPATATAAPATASGERSCIPSDFELPGASTVAPTAIPGPPQRAASAVPTESYQVVATYPHDRGAFTEGLVLDGGTLYEGTGLNGRSALRRVDLATGDVLQTCSLPQEYFGEGIAVVGDTIVQLTWQSHVGFIYDKNSFALRRAFSYPTEGWGLTYGGSRLIMSDGTATLHFLDPATLQEIGRVSVYDDAGPVVRLNELEYIRGEIYANVWQTNRIARIDPQTGQVQAWIDLSGLLAPADRRQPVDVLNGIAYDAEHDRLFVTGKLWPKLFEIKLV